MTILMMNENQTFTAEELSFSRLAKASYQGSNIPDLPTVTPAEPKPSGWNYHIFIKGVNDYLKINWVQVLKQLDCPELTFSNKKSFQEFLNVCDILKDTSKVVFPRELFIGKWENARSQLYFLDRFIEVTQTQEVSIYRDMKNKNLIEYDSSSSARNNSSQAISDQEEEVWLNKDIITRLIELSDSKYYSLVKSLFELPMRRCPEIILASLSQVNPRCGTNLLEEIFSILLSEILENASSHTKILEYVSRNNFDLLTNTLAEICRKENSSLNLSRILDISQTLKGSFLQRLAASEDFGFSIPLGLFASKREFVNLKTWIKERIDTSGDRFVQALVSYIHSHILVPILSIQSREGLVQATPKRLDILFETSHLNAGNLNIIMEALTQINSLRGKFSEKVLRSIESLQTELQKVLPDNFNSVTTTELEKESDRRLSEVYEGKVTLKAFINDLIQLKNSPRSQDKEVNACIIHNLIEEYPNYRNQNRPSIELTGRIFGNLIKEKIAPDVAHKICIQCFMDALNKKDRMLYMGISALKELQPVIHEPQYHHLCKKIFEIDQLRENHYELLYEILQNLKKTKNNMIIPDQYAIEVTNRHDQDAQKRKDQVPPSQPNTAQESESQHNLNASISNNQSSPTGSQNRKEIQHQPPQPTGPPPLINVDEIESTTLQEEYHKKYTQEVEFLQVSDQERRDNVFFLNNLSKDKLDEKARLLQNKLTDNDTITWFGCYLVWKCVPKDKQLLEMYSEFLNRLDKKSMTKKVLSSTYILLNLSFEYMTHKKSPSPDEMAIVRNCGTWLGLITLAKNKPIIKRELDLKLRLYKSLENKSLSKTLPILVHILASVNKSTIFKTFNPYIMGILGILIEIRADLSDRENVTVQIATLLRELNINERAERDIKHFNYIEKKRNNRTQQGRSSQFFNLRSLPESITIDMASLEAHIAGYDVDLRQLGAMAVDLSITDITKPLINQRSGVIAIGTTIELVLKDCAFEPSEEKLIQCAEAMVCKLVRSLTMATCVELLKGSIKSYMDHFLETQTQLPEQSRKAIKEIVALDNFQMACSIVARIVVENTLHELRQDPLMVDAIERRKLARQNNDKSFIDQRYVQYSQHIPPAIKPNPNGLTREELNVYLSMIEQPPMVNRPEMMGRRHPQPPAQGQPQTYPQDRRVLEERVGVDQLDENKIKNLLLDLDKFLSSATDESKFVAIQNVYSTLSKLLQQARDVEVHIPSLTMMILEAIFKPAHQVSSDKLRYYCDILAIYNSYSVKVTKYITEWYFESNSENKFSHQILIIFLRRNLLLISEFDAKYAILLDQVDAHNLAPLDCIVLVLKYLVIEHRIFMIYTFKKIVEKLISFQRKRFFNNVSQESMIFIENLSEFMKTNNDYTSAIKFRLTHIESDYKKLHQDVEEYFHRPDYAFYRLSIQLLKKWLMAKSELEMAQFIRSFEEEITRKSDKATISFFCYIIDVACKQAERFYDSSRKLVKLDYTYIDLISRMVTVLLKTMVSTLPKNRINLLEKILTAIILVMTKEHYHNNEKFNSKLFFKLFFNILYDLNWPGYDFQDNLKEMLMTIVQALHILQPIKYPSFSFAWLQLVSSKYLMAPLLRDFDTWGPFNNLILDLLIFYKEVFTVKSMRTQEMRYFYKGTLRLLLVLLHDFPDFLCHFNFLLLEEIPDNFMQVKNIMVSAYPKGMKIPDPFEVDSQNRAEMSEEYTKLPPANMKVDDRISCHNLQVHISNCIKKFEQADFDSIMKSFYIYGYKNDMHINKMLLDSFVLYVPYFIYDQAQVEGLDHQQTESYKHDSYMLFVKIMKAADFELRDALINSMFNNLRYPNQITFYFINLLILFFTSVDNDQIQEQIIKNLFERLIIEKPHPWGTLYLFDKLVSDSRHSIEDMRFYVNSKENMDYLIKFVMDFIKLFDANFPQEQEPEMLNN